ncbi:MAG TPA: endo-1,4-beta-xylanase, partial [Terriglobales bacterium]
MKTSLVIFFAALAAATVLLAEEQQPPALRDLFKGDFLIGAAINPNQASGIDTRGSGIVKAQFNTISPENVLKWEYVHPKLDSYNFAGSDRYVEFGEENHMVIIGHNLIWHNQIPKWVFEDGKGKPLNRKKLLQRMRDHIHKVVGRYKGRIKGWDVVNEAIADDGTMRKSPWETIIGDDYVAKAFQYAHEADPAAELYYNDYSLENDVKRNAVITLLQSLKKSGLPVAAVGSQEHDNLQWPAPEQVDATISAFSALGIKVMVTEFDIDVLPRVQKNGTAEVTLTAASQP